jgi:ribosomal protein S18 acetylase RimI-like enzyme
MQKSLQSTSIDIRLLTTEDEPFLWEMLYQALFIPPGHPPLPREVLQNPELSCYVQGWGKPGDEGFLAVDNGKPVGAVWIRLLTGDERGYGYIDDHTPELSIAILPEYRSKGIGGMLLETFLDEIKTRYAAICLSVSTDNPAIRLYRRLGFDVVDAVSGSLKMVKRLNQ